MTEEKKTVEKEAPVEKLEIKDEKLKKQEEKMFREISLNEKIFTYTKKINGMDLKFKVKMPTFEQREISDAMFSSTYNRMLLNDENLTTEQLLSIAKKRGTWKEEDESRVVLIDTEIEDLKEKKKETSSKKKKETLQLDLAKLIEEKFRLMIKMGRITQTSIEGVAESARYEYLLLNCVTLIDEEGNEKPLYKNKAELKNEQDLNRLERVLLDARSYWTGSGIEDFLHLED